MKLGVVQPPSSADIVRAIEEGVRAGIPGCVVSARAASPGHYAISVTAEEFRGHSRMVCQRLVYRTIGHLLRGENAPIHAVDSLETLVP
jgi:stress-induced morphogen